MIPFPAVIIQFLRRIPEATVTRLPHFLLMASVLFIAGCASVVLTGISSTPTPPPGPSPTPTQKGAVALSPQFVALAPGQQFRFVATASNGGELNWSVAAAANSSAGTIDASGTYTAPATVSQSENVVVTAALAASPQQDYATAIVSIIRPGAGPLPSVNRESAGCSVLHLPSRRRRCVGAIRDDHELRPEYVARAHSIRQWRPGAIVGRRDAGPDALSHARAGHAE